MKFESLSVLMNINNIKNYISKNDISFLIDFDRTIDIDKSGKCAFHRMFRLEHDPIKDFILKLDNDQIYLIDPYISVNCKLNDPYLNLSKRFLVTNKSDYNLIYSYLENQLAIFLEDFDIDIIEINYYFLIFLNINLWN